LPAYPTPTPHLPRILGPHPQDTFLPEPATSRSIPDWGKAIFSPLAVCMRPTTPEGLAGFIKYCIALTRAHIMVGPVAGARRGGEGDGRGGIWHVAP
jgi:hypothetical protein